jgi:hypothetical protein
MLNHFSRCRVKRNDSKPNPDRVDAPKEYWGTWEDKNSGRVEELRERCAGFSELTPAQRMRWLEEKLALKRQRAVGDLSAHPDLPKAK